MTVALLGFLFHYQRSTAMFARLLEVLRLFSQIREAASLAQRRHPEEVRRFLLAA